MNEPTLTHKDLARDVAVSETTIKSYRRKFPGFIPVAGYGKPIRFKPEALEVCLAIRDAFAQGLSVGETERRLKERFKQHPQPRPARDARRSGEVSNAALERIAELAQAMTDKLEELLQAQARTEQRLAGLERALGQPAEKPAEAAADTRVKATRIVTVRSAQGRVDSYALKDEPPPEFDAQAENSPETPPLDFLSLPVVIRTDQGEFLGVPGKLEVGPFVAVLEDMGRDTGAVFSTWKRSGDGWVFEVARGDNVRLNHHFSPTTTPRGNEVADLARLDVDGEQADWPSLVEYFRRIKDRL